MSPDPNSNLSQQQQLIPPSDHLQALPVTLQDKFYRPFSSALATLDQLPFISKVASANWDVQKGSSSLRANLIDYHMLICGLFLSLKEKKYAIQKCSSQEEDMRQQLWMQLTERCSELVAQMCRLVRLAIAAVRTEWQWSPPATFSGAVALAAEMLALRATIDDFQVAVQQMMTTFWHHTASI
ncbi:hypothetical protein TYRP_020040 [Tyrophagus putrescentiae]|nr:hypothetical protein TYRP_020040 [Tyrophagus putrescentiae]